MKLNIFTSIFFFGIALNSYAQENNIDIVLESIAKNNKSLAVNKAESAADILELKTQNNMEDPVFKYDYMAGSPTKVGNQTDITFTQEFNLPSVYKARKTVAQSYANLADSRFSLLKQELLLQAKLICIELIYREKLKNSLSKQEKKYQSILQAFENKLAIGIGNALDVNKAKVQLIDNSSKYQENEKEIARLNIQLIQLNGGTSILFSSTEYPLTREQQIKDENQVLDSWKESLNNLANAKISEAKKGALPKVEIGYHYQGVLDQNFQGGLIGVSLPLWSNKNKVAQAKSNKLLEELKYEEITTQIDAEKLQAKQAIKLAKEMLLKYEELRSSNAIQLLDRAFELKEITAFDYFLETSYYNDLEIKQLDFEHSYYHSLAILNRNTL